MSQMNYPLKESFEWVVPEFKTSPHASGRKVNIRGVALYNNAVSGNKRSYVADEVKKSARTLVGKPLTINHNDKRVIGNVVFAEENNGNLEYVAEVNNPEYVEKIRDKFTLSLSDYKAKWKLDPVNGVSVQADYLYNRCPSCGEFFTGTEDFNTHMSNQHGVRAQFTEPRGIVYNHLSVVEPPENPGISGTSLEIFETQGKSLSQLMESLTMAGEKTLNKPSFVASPIGSVALGASTVSARANVENPVFPVKVEEVKVGEVKTPPPVKEVKAEVEEIKVGKIELTFPQPVELDLPEPHDKYTLSPEEYLKKYGSSEVQLKSVESLKLGEPFASYKDFADCVAKNSGKSDPQAYCATIMRAVEEPKPAAKAKETSEVDVGAKRIFEVKELENKYAHEDLSKRLSESIDFNTNLSKRIDGAVSSLQIFTEEQRKIGEQTNKIAETVNANNTTVYKGFVALREVQVSVLSNVLNDVNVTLGKLSSGFGEQIKTVNEEISKLPFRFNERIVAVDAKVQAYADLPMQIHELQKKVGEASTLLEQQVKSFDAKVIELQSNLTVEEGKLSEAMKVQDEKLVAQKVEYEKSLKTLEERIIAQKGDSEKNIKALEEKIVTQKQDYEKIIGAVNEKYVTSEAKTKSLEEWKATYVVDEKKKLQETEDEKAKLKKQLEETVTRLDNVEQKVKDSAMFKSRNKVEENHDEHVEDPYKEAKNKEARK